MPFPSTRMRRLRVNPFVRSTLQETDLPARRLMMPLFVRPGRRQRVAIASMPGQSQLSVDTLVEEAKSLRRLGVTSLLLFGIPSKKDTVATEAYAASGKIPSPFSGPPPESPRAAPPFGGPATATK